MESTTTESAFFFDKPSEFHRAFPKAYKFVLDDIDVYEEVFLHTRNREAFEKCWADVSREAELIRSRLTQKSFREIADFFDCSKDYNFLPLLKVSAVQASVTCSENSRLLVALADYLKEKIHAKTAIVTIYNSTSLANAVINIVYQFICQQDSSRKLEDETCKSQSDPVGEIGMQLRNVGNNCAKIWDSRASSRNSFPDFSRQLAQSSMTPLQYLQKWYRESFCGRNLVLILDDIENLPEDLVPELVDLFSVCNIEDGMKLHIVLGTTGTSAGVHDILTCEQTSRIQLQRIKLPESRLIVEELVAEFMVNEKLPVRIEPKLICAIYDQFLSIDSSLRNFLKNLKMILLDYFVANKNAFLCFASSAEFQSMITHPKVLPEELGRIAPQLIEARIQHEKKKSYARPFVIQCIFATVKLLSSLGLKRSDLENFIAICDLASQYRKRHAKKIRRIDSIESSGSGHAPGDVNDTEANPLNQVRQKLMYSGASTWKEITGKWQEISLRFSSDLDVENFIKELTEVVEKVGTKKNAAENSTDSSTRDKARMDVSIKNWSKKKQRENSLLAVQPTETKSNALFAKSLLPFWDRLISLWCRLTPLPFECRSSNILKETMNTAPRRAVLRALCHPGKILGCKCCRTKSIDEIKQLMPDLCISFKQYRLLQTMKGNRKRILVPQWYEEFEKLYLDCMNKQNLSFDEDAQLKARFVHSLTELKRMGIVKQARKAEVVVGLFHVVLEDIA